MTVHICYMSDDVLYAILVLTGVSNVSVIQKAVTDMKPKVSLATS